MATYNVDKITKAFGNPLGMIEALQSGGLQELIRDDARTETR